LEPASGAPGLAAALGHDRKRRYGVKAPR